MPCECEARPPGPFCGLGERRAPSPCKAGSESHRSARHCDSEREPRLGALARRDSDRLSRRSDSDSGGPIVISGSADGPSHRWRGSRSLPGCRQRVRMGLHPSRPSPRSADGSSPRSFDSTLIQGSGPERFVQEGGRKAAPSQGNTRRRDIPADSDSPCIDSPPCTLRAPASFLSPQLKKR